MTPSWPAMTSPLLSHTWNSYGSASNKRRRKQPMSIESVLRRRSLERRSLIDVARGFVAQLPSGLRLRAAVVFGSVARGDFNVWSDIDLLIVADNVKGSVLERLDALGDRPGRVQPIIWTAAEWQQQHARRNPIVREAIDAGVWLSGSATALGRTPSAST
jgi:hypothetical protein